MQLRMFAEPETFTPLYLLPFDEMKQLIENADPKLAEAIYAVNWGNGSGQGKRVKTSVAGAMADPPRGVKSYINPIGAFHDAEDRDARMEVGHMSGVKLHAYQRARVAGLEHDSAMIWAEAGGGAWAYEEAYDLIQKWEASQRRAR